MLKKLFESMEKEGVVVQDNKLDELLVCSILDTVSGVFSSPFYSQNERTAIRSFGDFVPRDNMISSHCDDYVLYALGTFNDKSGLLVSLPTPKFLARARDFVKDSSYSTTNGEESQTTDLEPGARV